MSITVEATYQNGVLRLARPLPLEENSPLTITIHESAPARRGGYGLVQWTGRECDLDVLISDVENDPAEGQ